MMNEHNIAMARWAKDRFFSRKKVTNSGCWEWTGVIGDSGYGVVKRSKKLLRAHRLAWEYAKGPIPSGMLICHKCDNRKCINPDHLYVGTHQANSDDKYDRDRAVIVRGAPKGRGIDHFERFERTGRQGKADPLTSAQVDEMRRKRADGAYLKDLAEEYGVSVTYVWRRC